MNPAIEELISMSRQIGERVDLVQGGGGNTSVKADGMMYIKASGTPLKAMSETAGWVALGGTDNGQHPSMEWPMHQLLPRVVVHCHAVYANLWLCRVGGLVALGQQLKTYQPILIPYTTPGTELASVIQKNLVGQAQPRLLLLENHGVIVCGETGGETVELLLEINHQLKTNLAEFTVQVNPVNLPPLFPDAAVFTTTTKRSAGVLEILSANQYLHQTIQQQGGTVQPLPVGEGEKLHAMETEQYRIHINQ